MRIERKEFITIVICSVVFPSLMFSLITPRTAESPITSETLGTSTISQASEDYKIRLLENDGIISKMSLEDYVLSVVLREMPAEFETEAIKAQAVATRTYTLYRVLKQDKHTNADVCTDPTCCQAYSTIEGFLARGGTYKNIEHIKSAVDCTKGLIMTYAGELIEATYFSSSGGMTESAVAVWGTEVPYLKATESPGEKSVTAHTESLFFSADDLKRKLGIDPSSNNEPLVQNIQYTEGQGINTVMIAGKEFTGVELRSILNLRSTAIVITPTGEGVTITTKGYGHRVGMSQYGADAMARKGDLYTDILLHYYSGVEICNLSELGLSE